MEFIVCIKSMCNCRRIPHKLNIKPLGLYSVYEWFAGVYTSIDKNKIHFYTRSVKTQTVLHRSRIIVSLLVYGINLQAQKTESTEDQRHGVNQR